MIFKLQRLVSMHLLHGIDNFAGHGFELGGFAERGLSRGSGML